jgi:hypothetical protein
LLRTLHIHTILKYTLALFLAFIKSVQAPSIFCVFYSNNGRTRATDERGRRTANNKQRDGHNSRQVTVDLLRQFGTALCLHEPFMPCFSYASAVCARAITSQNRHVHAHTLSQSSVVSDKKAHMKHKQANTLCAFITDTVVH